MEKQEEEMEKLEEEMRELGSGLSQVTVPTSSSRVALLSVVSALPSSSPSSSIAQALPEMPSSPGAANATPRLLIPGSIPTTIIATSFSSQLPAATDGEPFPSSPPSSASAARVPVQLDRMDMVGALAANVEQTAFEEAESAIIDVPPNRYQGVFQASISTSPQQQDQPRVPQEDSPSFVAHRVLSKDGKDEEVTAKETYFKEEVKDLFRISELSSSSDEEENILPDDDGQLMEEDSGCEEGELKESPTTRRKARPKKCEPLANIVSSDDEEPKEVARSKQKKQDQPLVPQVCVSLEVHHRTIPVGVISAVLGACLIIEGKEGAPPLNEGSILWFTEQRLPVGIIDEIFGPVKKPFYTVRYNDPKEIPEAAKEGITVSYVSEFADFVLNNPDLFKRGYDACGENDVELSEEELEFSDDEKEAEYKRSKAEKKRPNSTKNPPNIEKRPFQGTHNRDNGLHQHRRHEDVRNKSQRHGLYRQENTTFPKNQSAQHQQHKAGNERSRFQRALDPHQVTPPTICPDTRSFTAASQPLCSPRKSQLPRQTREATCGPEILANPPPTRTHHEASPQQLSGLRSLQLPAQATQGSSPFQTPFPNPPLPDLRNEVAQRGRHSCNQQTLHHQPYVYQPSPFHQQFPDAGQAAVLGQAAQGLPASIGMLGGNQYQPHQNLTSFHIGMQAIGVPVPAPVPGVPSNAIFNYTPGVNGFSQANSQAHSHASVVVESAPGNLWGQHQQVHSTPPVSGFGQQQQIHSTPPVSGFGWQQQPPHQPSKWRNGPQHKGHRFG